MILGADQKECMLWGQECSDSGDDFFFLSSGGQALNFTLSMIYYSLPNHVNSKIEPQLALNYNLIYSGFRLSVVKPKLNQLLNQLDYSANLKP